MNRPIPQDELLALCEQGVTAALAAGADQAEVFATSHTESEASIEKNDLNQTKRVEETTFGIRVMKKGSLGFCTSNQAESLKEAAREAVVLADLSPADEHNGIPQGQEASSSSPSGPLSSRSPSPRIDSDVHGTLGRDPCSRLETHCRHRLRELFTAPGNRQIAGANAGGYLFGMCVDGNKGEAFPDGDRTRCFRVETLTAAALSRFVQNARVRWGLRKERASEEV